jgi:hypothetical protein
MKQALREETQKAFYRGFLKGLTAPVLMMGLVSQAAVEPRSHSDRSWRNVGNYMWLGVRKERMRNVEHA